MTDRQLLSSYTISPMDGLGYPLFGYAVPVTKDIVTIYTVDDRAIKTMQLDTFFKWALSTNMVVEPPSVEPFTVEDEKADSRRQVMDDKKRLAEIEYYLNRIQRLLK